MDEEAETPRFPATTGRAASAELKDEPSPPPPPPPLSPLTPQPGFSRGTTGPRSGNGPRNQSKTRPKPKRTVCDHCRRRRIRCDGNFPCEQCLNASLQCKREHVPKKRGPKRGHGRVINELRAKEGGASNPSTSMTSTQRSLPDAPSPGDNPTEYVRRRLSAACPPLNFEGLANLDATLANESQSSSAISSPPPLWATVPPNLHANAAASQVPEPRSVFSTDQYRPHTPSYLHLIPQCVELYYEHIYPIMPLLYMPSVRETVTRPMSHSEKNLVYALCALTSMHMSGKSIEAPGPPSWEVVGRFFLDETIAVRQGYDYLEDLSLSSVISSFYLSTSFFEINQSRKSWYYLREALHNAQDLGLQDDATYYGLTPEETLCRQRVFWILFVTERSFAILRNKPITFKRTPSLPSTRHPYESPDIHAGFLQLVSSYTPLEESFVNAWNEGSDPGVSANTFLALQNLLALPPAFLRPRGQSGRNSPPSSSSFFAPSSDSSSSEPTDIQKADLLITQQWLRLIVWQSSMRQNLLSWSNLADSNATGSSGCAPSSAGDANATSSANNNNNSYCNSSSAADGSSQAAPNNSMCFSFPLVVARDTASILASLPSKAVEVHGMGIMEKIFEIGSWCVNVLGACESVGFSTSSMDLTAGDLGVLGSSGGGRRGASHDPIEFFVRTLSASPNSRSQYAERLLRAAGENPGCMRVALSPPVGMGFGVRAAAAAAGRGRGSSAIDGGTLNLAHRGGGMAAWNGTTHWGQHGTVVGEVADEDDSSPTAMGNDAAVLGATPMASFSSFGNFAFGTMGTSNVAPHSDDVGPTDGVDGLTGNMPMSMTRNQRYHDYAPGTDATGLQPGWSNWAHETASSGAGSFNNATSEHGSSPYAVSGAGVQDMEGVQGQSHAQSQSNPYSPNSEEQEDRYRQGLVGVW